MICIGGSAAVYANWKKCLDKTIELNAYELAGRGKRFLSPFHRSMEEAIEDLSELIIKNLDTPFFAFFGHSMGSFLVHELAYKIKSITNMDPVHIFFSGINPPHIREHENLHTLPNDEFINEVFKLGGTAKEFMENQELLNLFIPILKSDYKILEIYKCVKKDIQLNCNISVLNGSDDTGIDFNVLDEWKDYSTKRCQFYNFEGDHFFINEHYSEITDIINDSLNCELIQLNNSRKSMV